MSNYPTDAKRVPSQHERDEWEKHVSTFSPEARALVARLDLAPWHLYVDTATGRHFKLTTFMQVAGITALTAVGDSYDPAEPSGVKKGDVAAPHQLRRL